MGVAREPFCGDSPAGVGSVSFIVYRRAILLAVSVLDIPLDC